MGFFHRLRRAVRKLISPNHDAERKAREAREAAARAREAAMKLEEARLKVCKTIKEDNIPKLEKLITASKQKLSDLKNMLKDCEKEYDNKCKVDTMTQDLNNNQILYTNLKGTLSTLTNTYDLEKCDITETCDIFDKKNKLAISQYNISDKLLKYKKNKHEICLDPYRNECAPILRDLEKSKEYIDKNMTLLKNVETFATINDNRELTNLLQKIQSDNGLVEKELREYKSKNVRIDNYLQYDEEVCKNILLTTAGSVMLYYLFFEL